jgi:hypothetical protein
MSCIGELRIEFSAALAKQPYVLYRTGRPRKGQALEVLADEVLYRGPHSQVYRGTAKETGSILALKLCFSQESADELKVEAAFYEQLKDLQGDAVPTCFGYFEAMIEATIPACLVMEFCGESLQVSFDELPLEQRCVSPPLSPKVALNGLL